jgi:IS4 transposase
VLYEAKLQVAEEIERYKHCFKDIRHYRVFEKIYKGILGSGQMQITKMVSSLNPELQNIFYQAKASYRFLDNEAVRADEILKEVYKRSEERLAEAEEVVLCVDFSPIKKPYAYNTEEICEVSKDKSRGYQSLSIYGVELGNKLRGGVLYYRVFSYKEEEYLSENTEVKKGIESVYKRMEGYNSKRRWFVYDRRFDDKRWFKYIRKYHEKDNSYRFVHRIYKNRKIKVGEKDVKLLELVKRLEESKEEVKDSYGVDVISGEFEVKLKIRGRYQMVKSKVYSVPITVDGEETWLVVSRIKKLKARGLWILLTNQKIENKEDAYLIMRVYSRRWAVEDFHRLIKEGLNMESFLIEGIKSIRRLVSIMIGAANFVIELLYEAEEGDKSAFEFKEFLLSLGGRLGTKWEKSGIYIVLRGLHRLLTGLSFYELIEEH